MFNETLASSSALVIKQKKELAELFGFETRNKYELQTSQGEVFGFAAEQQKGSLGFLVRQFLGHWRTFDIQIFDKLRNPMMTVHHPFRFYFQSVEVKDQNGTYLGRMEQRFSFFSKKFEVLDAQGRKILSVSSPLWKLWTFSFTRNGKELASIKKKWGGLLKEAFVDADTFLLEFKAGDRLNLEERKLLLAAALFIDLQYFEAKAN